MKFTIDIGLEVHAELSTRSKMFCSCAVVDSISAPPNSAVCPVCEGLPGALPVLNERAVEYALRVALALECTIAPSSIFVRKNYFYPDLPKGFQISQFEFPLAENGHLEFSLSGEEQTVRIRRVHLEEDTGKLTHVHTEKEDYSLVDLNRAGVPLLEIVSEPDMHSAEEASAYARALRSVLQALGVNSGDMEKGVIRFEANVSLRPVGSDILGTRVEIKNLNSFRSMERAIRYQLELQQEKLELGKQVEQETLGWDDLTGTTYSQRSKEDSHDYRYFPEPDLPPLIVSREWIERVRTQQPELPREKAKRFEQQYRIKRTESILLVEDAYVAEFFEKAVASSPETEPGTLAKWMIGDVFAWMKENGSEIADIKARPESFAKLVSMVQREEINQATGKKVLARLLVEGGNPEAIISKEGLQQVSDINAIKNLVAEVLAANPGAVEKYRSGKPTVEQWLFGQVMRVAGGKANPALVKAELNRQLSKPG
jgi:aspartyl-tRNA(Asn)/glutamyl-tRNA(Gln) amidotransferase subunit B